jgi:hypothetical protein
MNKYEYEIVLGTHDAQVSDPGSATLKIADIIMHPSYKKPFITSNDVALIRLAVSIIK